MPYIRAVILIVSNNCEIRPFKAVSGGSFAVISIAQGAHD
jgi:hypothetical protein